jgi:hypothetical protein
MRTTIHWTTEELGVAAKQMAADDMDKLSRFICKLVAAEIKRRERAGRLVDTREPYRTEAE